MVKPAAVAREIEHLRACLKRVRLQATRWDRDQLDSVNLKRSAETNEVLAQCHITLGREAFLIAERAFWKRPRVEDGPDLSCRFNDLDFEPVYKAMVAPAKITRRRMKPATRIDYSLAVRHFERAHVLSGYHEALFYLGMIALRNDDLTEARARFGEVSAARRTREQGRHKLRISVAVFASLVALLQGRLAEAESAMKRAHRVDTQDVTVFKNQGYLCERLGEPDKAAFWYRKALEWEPQDGYALRRLKPLEGAPVIELKRPSDFHEKFGEIARALQKTHGSKRAPKPLPEATIDQLRLPNRRVNGNSVKLPESAKTILRYDRNFALWEGDAPLLRAMIGAKRAVRSANVDQLVRTDKWTPFAKAFKKLPARVPVWNDDPNLPACIPLHSNPKGEQLIFLYVGEPDETGEYPIARYQAEPELWVEEASLIHLVVSEAVSAGVRITCAFDFDKLRNRARKRNAKYDERLSDHPLVKAIEAT